ncbi:MAG: VWA domain-containing protein [Eubacteriales bacterium]|nr:VWA domain-containing protein [Eubacteriales bacterium]
MKKRQPGKLITMILMLVFCLSIHAAADFDRITISQIKQSEQDVYLYINTLNNSGTAASNTSLSKNALKVLVDNDEPLEVLDLTSYQAEGVAYTFCVDISRSMTDSEMTQVKEGITNYVNSMSANDYARLVTFGETTQEICAFTKDHDKLLSAVGTIERTAMKTYLYQGLTNALNTYEKQDKSLPERKAIIVFSDGMDDSDGADSEDQVIKKMSSVHVPIYAVGMQGNDSSATLKSLSNMARTSGGAMFSYSEYTAAEALDGVADFISQTYCLHVQPTVSQLNKNSSSNWVVQFNDSTITIESPIYTFRTKRVEEVTEAPITEIETTEAPTTELVTLPPETEPELTGMAKVIAFAKENLFIVLPVFFIILGIIIAVIAVLVSKSKKKNQITSETIDDDWINNPIPNNGGEYEPTMPDDAGMNSGYNPYGGYGENERTIAEDPYADSDDERTVAEDVYDDYDDEATVDGSQDDGITIEFEINFEGQTSIEHRRIRDRLILGRNTDTQQCDVDVTLGSRMASRKQTSRQHALITLQPDGMYVTDNGKTKTYLNGSEVRGETILHDNDVLSMGRASVKVRFR